MRDGREEFRMAVGSLGQLELLDKPRDSECAQFENISEHGVRVFSRRSWQSGDRLLITSRIPPFCCIAAKVVYCETLRDGLYAIGCRSTEGGVIRLFEQRPSLCLKDTQASEHSAASLDFSNPAYSIS